MSTPYADTGNMAPGGGRSPLRAVLGSRSYRFLWGAQFVSGLAGFFNYVAVAWLTLALTRSTLAAGTVLAAASVPLSVLILVGGAVRDRVTPRTTMIWAGLARSLVMVLLAALALTHSI